MIQANELRITNIVHFVKENVDAEIGHHNLGILLAYPSTNDYEPIPLTEEWLLKFGFEKQSDYFFYNNNYRVESFRSSEWCFRARVTKNESYPIAIIEYVHQLQNLYFALTGKELKLKNDDTSN